MTLIKILLIAGFLGVLVWGFRNRNRAGMRASARVAALLLASFAIASILNPGIPQAAANAVGVSRGTDLILYALVLAFVVTSTGLYFRTRELERQIGAIIRTSAVREAVLDPRPRPIPTAGSIEGSSG
jgi:hypothetical protein